MHPEGELLLMLKDTFYFILDFFFSKLLVLRLGYIQQQLKNMGEIGLVFQRKGFRNTMNPWKNS